VYLREWLCRRMESADLGAGWTGREGGRDGGKEGRREGGRDGAYSFAHFNSIFLLY